MLHLRIPPPRLKRERLKLSNGALYTNKSTGPEPNSKPFLRGTGEALDLALVSFLVPPSLWVWHSPPHYDCLLGGTRAAGRTGLRRTDTERKAGALSV